MVSSDLSRVPRRRPGIGFAKATLVAGQVAAHRVRTRPRPAGLRILYWHRIAESHDPLAISPRAFLRQLDAIEASGLPVIDLYGLQDGQLDPDDAGLVLTFDDGYRDVLEHALPELERRGFAATVFVVPGAIAGDVHFDWYPPGEMPPLIGWDEMRSVEARSAIRFEPHTMTHPILPRIAREQADFEIRESKRVVEQELGREARLFCYPAGYHSSRDVELVREAGFTAALTCEFGTNHTPFAEPFELRRTIVEASDPLWVFAGRLDGATDRAPLGRRSRRVEATL
jgi:peptidoglycan/xylan/chitin deacetylase (PgdA/CDA1 family)